MKVFHHPPPRVLFKKAKYPSRITEYRPELANHFVDRGARSRPHQIPYEGAGDAFHTFQVAGPTEGVILRSGEVLAIVNNSGGVAPGLNPINRGIFLTLNHVYRVPDGPRGGIWGVKSGYPTLEQEPWVLGEDYVTLLYRMVRGIHREGGTILTTDRGDEINATKVVRNLLGHGINMVFTVGGDGTQLGAIALYKEIQRHRLPISVIHLPKTVDCDLPLVDKTFGFDTAVNAVAENLWPGHVEAANSARYGIWIKGVMGRASGELAVAAAVQNGDVDVLLIPEVPVKFEGPDGLFSWLIRELPEKKHFLIAVAEGVSEKIFEPTHRDLSGNLRYPPIWTYLHEGVEKHLRRANWQGRAPRIRCSEPYIEARGVPPSGADMVYCHRLASNAVHAAFSGYTGVMVSEWQGESVLVPMEFAAQYTRRFDASSELWRQFLEMSGPRPYYTDAWEKVG